MVRPERCSALCVAGMTPVSISSGSLPLTENVWNRARGVRPSSTAFSSLMISAAEAPSVSGEELPGVIFQSISGKRAANAGSTKEGFSPARPSGVVRDRKRGGEGKSVYVSVDHGGGSRFKKQ